MDYEDRGYVKWIEGKVVDIREYPDHYVIGIEEGNGIFYIATKKKHFIGEHVATYHTRDGMKFLIKGEKEDELQQ